MDLSFACGMEETNSSSRVSQTGNFPHASFFRFRDSMFFYLFSQPKDLALGYVKLVLGTQNLPIDFMETVFYFYFISSVLSVTQLFIYSGVSHA